MVIKSAMNFLFYRYSDWVLACKYIELACNALRVVSINVFWYFDQSEK